MLSTSVMLKAELRRKERCSGCDEKVKGVVFDVSWEVDMLD